MKGHIRKREDIKDPWYEIIWYWEGKYHKISWYNGRRMRSLKGNDGAERLLHQMQGDVERGAFSLDKYLKGQSQVIPFLYDWLEECKENWSPGTYNNYKGYVVNHLEPFFQKNILSLQEVQLNIINKLKKGLKKIPKHGEEEKPDYVPQPLDPKGKKNVIDCLRSAMRYAKRSRLIDIMPDFPTEGEYQIEEPEPRCLTPQMQREIIEAIPEQHRPIFWFLAYHMRRPSEAMRLMKGDYDPELKYFTIRRGISANKEVEHTKTKKKHEIPCRKSFIEILESMPVKYPFSPYLFTCDESMHKHKRYTRAIMERLWKEACAKVVGVKITLYEGTKHTTAQAYLDAGYSHDQVQAITDHASIKSVKRYARVKLENKRALLDGDVIPLDVHRKKPGNDLAINGEEKV
jgi:integrase